MDRHNPEQTRTVKRKRRRKIRKRAFFILIPLIALLGVSIYGGYLYIKADSVLSDSYEDDGRDKSALRDAQVDPTEDNVSILIMGIDENDTRDNAESALTDALMLATLNKEDNTVNIVSIPRDSYVHIPEVGYEDKINHAHSFGGTKATVETVENLLDIPVDYNVKVNFNGFVEIVDALDGIEVEVPYTFSESNSTDQGEDIHLVEGEQTLDGEEALALARTRKLDNDIERGKRQQDIITAMMDKAISVNSLLNYGDILDAVGDNMSTNLTFGEMKSFISYATNDNDLDIETHTLKGTDYQPGSTYYWQLDQFALGETQSMLKNHLDIAEPTTVEQKESENASGSDPY
ncbi:LCP family protein required for cell wall assembly [Virgibacillus natechei]|uniref:LCP family protein required for cell wall assembly n=1 Tax=Virgibacillus natechei TaxID=1216297 RepID=A0ABS4IEK3_9BACI|nr:LCP family protein [Virgibacillus natechei]MBP1969379.1 LCP family protein required for cell wall assembly [Virgibacillus natechei]UZD12523.1 LCP family protein [Virgibacillus natechei]